MGKPSWAEGWAERVRFAHRVVARLLPTRLADCVEPTHTLCPCMRLHTRIPADVKRLVVEVERARIAATRGRGAIVHDRRPPTPKTFGAGPRIYIPPSGKVVNPGSVFGGGSGHE
jgi:hypothetical protein